MNKKTIFLLTIIFLLTLTSVFFWYFLQEKKTQARFYLNFEGGEADIYLGNKKLSSPPIKDYLTPGGWYELKIVTPNYTYTTPLRLSPQTATIVDWKTGVNINNSSGVIYELFPIESPASELEIITLPDRAIIQLSNLTEKFFSPSFFDNLQPGEYNLNLNLPGYDSIELPLTLHQSHRLKLTIKLAQSQ